MLLLSFPAFWIGRNDQFEISQIVVKNSMASSQQQIQILVVSFKHIPYQFAVFPIFAHNAHFKREMTHRQMQSKGKSQPSKIQYIEDKKIERNGSISYLVKYRGIEHQNWASKDYLCTDQENKKCIQRYQMLMGAELQASSSSDVVLASKKKIAKKEKIVAKAKQQKTKATDNLKAKQKQLSIVEKPAKATIQKSQERNVKKKYEVPEQEDYYSEVEVNEEQLKPQPTEHASEVKKQPQSLSVSGVTKIEGERKQAKKQGQGDFKVTRAQINHEGQISFKIKYENGVTGWVEGDWLKNEYPLKVIKYYQKRISWNC